MSTSERTSRCGKVYGSKASRQSHESRCSKCKLAKVDPDFAATLAESAAFKALPALRAQIAAEFPCEACRDLAHQCVVYAIGDLRGHGEGYVSELDILRESCSYLENGIACPEHRDY